MNYLNTLLNKTIIGQWVTIEMTVWIQGTGVMFQKILF